MAKHSDIGTDIIQLLSPKQAWHYGVVPYKQDDNGLHLYVSETKGNADVLTEELEVVLGYNVCLQETGEEDLSRLLGKYYRLNKQEEQLSEADTIDDNFLKKVLNDAYYQDISDIHLEIHTKSVARIRYRIDGVLIERHVLSKPEYLLLVNKIKVSAHLDIAEKRRPQDGRLSFAVNEDHLDIRVSVLPTMHGEKVVLRILGKNAGNILLDHLGLNPVQMQLFRESLQRKQGIVLLSGPTGSGKTTTLYAGLKEINSKEKNILTIEDPIEYTLEGVNQVQVNEGIGLSYSESLRSFLRQDPDIIMIGEIRDQATATMVVRASLTGHLVLSTIHTNSAWGIISRLVDMGIPSYLLQNTISLLAAQRLVRKLCPQCKALIKDKGDHYKQAFEGYSFTNMYSAMGCEKCYFTGYSGRTAIYEIISVDQLIRNAIAKEESNIDHLFEQNGVISIKEQAIMLVEKGITSFEEVYSVINSYY